MVNILIVLILIASGMFFRRIKILPDNFELGLNKILVYFFIPVLTLLYVPEIIFKKSYLLLVLSPWVVYTGAILFFSLLSKFIRIPPKSRGALIMTSGIGSISFVGFPFFEMFYGEEGLAFGVVLSLAGTFVVCNSLGILTALFFSKKGELNFYSLLKSLLMFPPFLMFLISLLLNIFDYTHPLILKEILQKLSKPFSVLALFTVGYQISFKKFDEIKSLFLMGQFYKLILAPMVVFLIVYSFYDVGSVIAKVCIIGAGIGSMSTISIIASEFNLNPKLAMSMTSLGIPLSIISVLIIQFLIS